MQPRFRDGKIRRPPQTLLLVSMAPSLLGWLLPEMNGEEREPGMLWCSFMAWQMEASAKVCSEYGCKMRRHLSIEITDYPWEEQATPIIDIGGGMGSFEEMLLSVPKNNKLTFTIFDIDQTIHNTRKARQHNSLFLSLCNIGQ